MRAALFSLLTFLALVCHFLRPAVTDPTEPVTSRRVAVGDSFQDANRRLLASGAEDFSQFVGIIALRPNRMRWYILKDGTCLCVRLITSEESPDGIVRELSLGEPGRGYGNKIQWFAQQQRDVNRVDLP